MYEHLQTEKITRTIERLHARIQKHFPDAGLTMVAGELAMVAERTEARIKRIQRANLPLRLVVIVLLVAILAVLGLFLRAWLSDKHHSLEIANDLGALLQAVEATLGSAFFLSAAIVSLVTIERRIKRNRALSAIHELRAMAQIIDMHQLQKDPEQLAIRRGEESEGSEPPLTLAGMSRYLDYCSDLLSLLGNVVALYVQEFTDPAVLEAVDDVQHLTNAFSSKIWQKIMLLDLIAAREVT